MSDEIDRHIDSIRKEQHREKDWRTWASQYNAATSSRPNSIELDPLVRLDGPYLDLVTEFSQRSIAAGLGGPRLLLKGPDGQIFAARLFDLDSFKRISFLDMNSALRREKRQLRQANQNLQRDGQQAVLLRISDGYEGEVNVEWYVAGGDLYKRSRMYPAWGDRDSFAKLCAVVLSKNA